MRADRGSLRIERVGVGTARALRIEGTSVRLTKQSDRSSHDHESALARPLPYCRGGGRFSHALVLISRQGNWNLVFSRSDWGPRSFRILERLRGVILRIVRNRRQMSALGCWHRWASSPQLDSPNALRAFILGTRSVPRFSYDWKVQLSSMATIPAPVYMLKPGEDLVLILVNRTLTIISQDDGKFLVSVTDRDYQYDPSGEKRDIVFREAFGSLLEAKAELEKQVNLSLAAGLIHNNLQHGPF
jgi:hypothetical protein